jgi:hypothetical protein
MVKVSAQNVLTLLSPHSPCPPFCEGDGEAVNLHEEVIFMPWEHPGDRVISLCLGHRASCSVVIVLNI